MTRSFRTQTLYTMAALLLLLSLILLRAGYARTMEPDLAARVAALKVGINGYIIGARLTAAQKETAAAGISNDSYAGTYKFQDGDIFIVAASNDDTILAVFQRIEAADMDQAKVMVSGLMGLFGEPTTMAHDKLIYWAYTDEGKINEEAFNKLKEENKTVNILATVKFNSTFPITGDDPDSAETGINYFIISSAPLSRDFISREK